MAILKRMRNMAIQTCLLGSMALTLASGITTQDASAAKVVAVNCNSLYSSAMWAGDQYLAAQRRGDTATADFWWSIYNSLELSYARNCMGDMAS